MDKKALAVLGLAIFFAGLTAYAVNQLLKRQAGGGTVGDTQKVVIAVSPILMGQQITPDLVTLDEFSKGSLPEGTIDDLSKVVNRVSLSEVTIREPILLSRLAPPGSAAGLSAVIPPGMRASTVKVDEVIGVAGFVNPGTYVDVVATIRGAQNESMSRIILQHVKVLASGTQTENKDGGPVEVKTVTLQVTPAQAESLALASVAGNLQLVMRSSVDEDVVKTEGVDTNVLFGAAPRLSAPPTSTSAPTRRAEPKVEPPPPPPTVTVELIQGTKRSTQTFQ